MLKKMTALLLCLCMLFSLAACGSENEEASASTPLSSAAASEPVEAEAPVEEGSATEATEAPAQLGAAEIQVFIAASLNSAFEEIIALYREQQPNVTIAINADSSGTLQQQIQEGYACDIFFSAGKKQMTTLEGEGFVIEGTNTELLENQLCLVTYPGSGTAVTGFDSMDKAGSVALADGSVPVGKYTRTALMNLGILGETEDPSAYTTQQVSEALGGVEINECSNVSKVAQAVMEGANEFGTVYYSDYYDYRDKLEILAQDDGTLTGPIIYPVGRIVNREATEAQTAAADDFFAFLQTEPVLNIFRDYCMIVR